MSQDLQYLNAQMWANDMQIVFFKENVALGIANTRLESNLVKGTRVHRPYSSNPRVATYTKGSAITNVDISSTDEYLDVDTTKVVPFYIDEVDAIQNYYETGSVLAQRSMRILSNVIDQKVLATGYAAAADDVYNDDVGGSGATTAITPTTSNIQQIFTAASRKLSSLNIPSNERIAVVSPRVMETIRLYIGGKDTNLADEVGTNGLVGKRFGFRIFESNNCPFTARWTPADNPSESDTVTIQGITFTFNATPSGAGSVDIGGTTAASITNLVAAVNDSGTAGTTYIQLTDANRYKLNTLCGVVATDGTTYMSIVGYGDIVVSSLQSSEWSVQIQHLVFAMNKAIDLVVQTKPNLEIKDVYNMLGKNYFTWMNMGTKVFTDMADGIVDVNINASAWA